MKWFVLIAIFILIYMEFTLFVWIANETSVFTAIMLGLLTTFGGIALVKRQGIENLKKFQHRILNRENGSFETINVLFILLAGLFLLIPGFITDALGLLLLIPIVQRVLYNKLKHRVKMQGQVFSHRGFDDDIIDGEFSRKEEEQTFLEKRDDEK